jgi:hypothetical protein
MAFNSNIRGIPRQVWRPGNFARVELGHFGDEAIQQDPELRAQLSVQAYQQRALGKFHAIDYTVGDWIRLKVTDIWSEARKKMKSGNSKLLIVTHTPMCFRITQISYPGVNNINRRRRYRLVGENNVITANANNTPKWFFSSSFVAANPASPAGITMQQSMVLNEVNSVPEHDTIYE